MDAAEGKTKKEDTLGKDYFLPKIYCTPLQKLLVPNLASFNCTKSVMECYCCQYCEFKTNLLTQLKNHNLTHSSKPTQVCTSPLYSCPKCNFQTHSVLILIKHFSDICNIQCLVKCDECPFKTTRRRYLRRHKWYKHTPAEQIQWFQCGSCSYKTKWKGNLKGHILSIHLKKKPAVMTCTECSYTTQWKKSLKCHVLSKHFLITSPKWIKCDLCSFKTLRNDSLKRHVKSLHNLEMQWLQCEICQLKIKRKDHLKRHMQEVHAIFDNKLEKVDKSKHTEVFDFVECSLEGKDVTKIAQISEENKCLECSICQAKLKEKDLKFHMQETHALSHHIENNENKWFHCDQCPFSAKFEQSLKIHRQSHTRAYRTGSYIYFKCALCPLQTTRKDSLKRHIREKHIDWKKKNDNGTTNSSFKSIKKDSFKQCLNEKQNERQLKQRINKRCESKSQKEKLTKVIENVDGSVKNFCCDHCQFTTGWKNSLKMHCLLKHKKNNLFS